MRPASNDRLPPAHLSAPTHCHAAHPCHRKRGCGICWRICTSASRTGCVRHAATGWRRAATTSCSQVGAGWAGPFWLKPACRLSLLLSSHAPRHLLNWASVIAVYLSLHLQHPSLHGRPCLDRPPSTQAGPDRWPRGDAERDAERVRRQGALPAVQVGAGLRLHSCLMCSWVAGQRRAARLDVFTCVFAALPLPSCW